MVAQWWEPGFLANFISLSLTAQNVLMYFALICGAIGGVLFLVTLSGDTYDGSYTSFKQARAFLLVLSLIEISAYELCPDAETFVSRFTEWWDLVKMALIAVLLVGQGSLTQKVLTQDNDINGRGSDLMLFLPLFCFFVVGLFITMLFTGLRAVAVILGFVVICIQILIDLLGTISRNASFGAFLKNSLWMIICGVAMMCLAYSMLIFFSFWRMVVVVFVVCFILGVFSGSGSSKARCCGNCRSFSDGYCYYRKQYKSTSDCCDKFE